MDIFDFINPDQIDDLPDDENLAFSEFVRISSRNFAEKTKSLDDQDETSWRHLQDARYGFTNVVVGAAKRFKIEPFSLMEVPQIKNYADIDYRQFRADLDHYLTQILIDNSIRGKRESVILNQKSKDKIRDYINAIKKCVDDADLSDSKKNSLHSKIAEFEKELEKRRLSIFEVANITLLILGIPGSLWASYEITNKLVSNIMETVAEAKVADDDQRKLPPVQRPVALIPPRPRVIEVQSEFGRATSRDLDDEIPF